MTAGIAESGVFTAVWWALAILTVACAVLVVRLQDLVKAAMALIGSFLGIAALFVMLNAEFLAIVQVLVYAGAGLDIADIRYHDGPRHAEGQPLQ